MYGLKVAATNKNKSKKYSVEANEESNHEQTAQLEWTLFTDIDVAKVKGFFLISDNENGARRFPIEKISTFV